MIFEKDPDPGDRDLIQDANTARIYNGSGSRENM